MKALVVEDEFVARCILQRFLAQYGECDVAVDGQEAVSAVAAASAAGQEYDLVCLDIGLPKLSGQAVLEQLRELERARGVPLGRGCKVIMTTVASSKANVLGAFRGGADAYLPKPIGIAALHRELLLLKLVAADVHL